MESTIKLGTARYLLDSNILLRLVQVDSPHYNLVRSVVKLLSNPDTSLCYTSQNVAEFWNVSTRPRNRNGLGFSIAQTDAYARDWESLFEFLPDNETIHRIWRELLVTHSISGVKVYDARLAAHMYSHEVKTLITFNIDDFRRFPDLDTVHPEMLLQRLQSNR